MRTQSIIVGIGEMIQLVSSLKNSDKWHDNRDRDYKSHWSLFTIHVLTAQL